MAEFIAAYPTLAGMVILGLLGMCLTLVGTVWQLANSTIRGLKTSIVALNETLGEAFGEMKTIDRRLSRLEGEHDVNHHRFRVAGVSDG